MRFVALALLLILPKGHAAPTCERLKYNWKKYYYADLGVTWELTENFDCPNGEGKIAEAMYHLHNPALVKEKSAKDDPPDFYRFVKNRVESTRYKADCPYVAGARDGVLTLCQGFFEKSAEYRASTLVHEARHLAKTDPNHVKCTRSAYVVCDEKLSNDSKGSGFNYDLVYLSWVLHGSSYHELTKWVLQSEINALVPDRFNEVTEKEIKEWRVEPSK